MSAIENPAVPASTRGRAAHVALWAVQILLALIFAFGGVNKLLGLQREVVEGFAKLGGDGFRIFVGALETLGAIGLVVPRLAGAAALGLCGVMVGAVITHLVFQPPAAMAVVPGVFLVVLLVIARARRAEIRDLVASLRA